MIRIKDIKPMYTAVVTTADKYEDDAYIAGSTLIDSSKIKRGLKEYQRVVKVGSFVKEVKEGDLVAINPRNYAVRKYAPNSLKGNMDEYTNEIVSYSFNVLEIDGKEHLMIQERDIDFVITDYEEIEEDPEPSIIIPAPIIMA